MVPSAATFIIYLVSSVVCLGFWGYFTVRWWDSLTKGLRWLSGFSVLPLFYAGNSVCNWFSCGVETNRRLGWHLQYGTDCRV